MERWLRETSLRVMEPCLWLFTKNHLAMIVVAKGGNFQGEQRSLKHTGWGRRLPFPGGLTCPAGSDPRAPMVSVQSPKIRKLIIGLPGLGPGGKKNWASTFR